MQLTNPRKFKRHDCDSPARASPRCAVNLTLIECQELELTDVECIRLSNISSRVRSQLDVDNDGDVDARDFALRLQTISDLNVTAVDCEKLELDAVDCSALADFTIRLRGRFDLDADGEYDVDDLSRVVGVATSLLLAASDTRASEDIRWYNQTVHVPLTLMHNTTSPHAAVALLADLTAARWKDAHVGDEEASYKVTNHPLPPTAYEDLFVRLLVSFFAATFLAIPLSYLPTSAATAVVQERVCRAKHVQMVSGTSTAAYWASHFVADFTSYSISAILIVACLVYYGDQDFVGSFEQGAATLTLLLVYGGSMVL